MAAAPPPSSLVKLTVNVVRTLYEKFRVVAARRGITETEALQQALATYTFIDRDATEWGAILHCRPSRSTT